MEEGDVVNKLLGTREQKGNKAWNKGGPFTGQKLLNY